MPASLSADTILRQPGRALPSLRQLFGAYFSQDWDADAENWGEALDQFIDEASAGTVQAAIAEIRALLAADLAEAQLAEVLYPGLDCNVEPVAIGMTPSTWLRAVLDRLLAAS